MAEIYLNSRFIGKAENAASFIDDVKDLRRKGSLSENLSVYYNAAQDEVHVFCDEGRAQRPLIIIKEGKPLLTEKHLQQLKDGELTWVDLIRQGVIEYLDAAEEEGALVAPTEGDLTVEHTHMEISPGTIVGITTSLVPFGNYNQSSRLIIGSKNQKQALGFYAANFHLRMDMDANILHYSQNPIVKTKIHDVVDYSEHPSGQNMVVAVMCYDGYNMEDGVVLNKGSVERGLGRSTYFKPVSAEELRYYGGLVDQISIPDKETKGYRSEKDYRFLEEDGMVYPEAKVNEGDVIIGKTSPPRFLSSMEEYNLSIATRRESSVTIKHGEQGVADFVVITENEEGNKLVQVRLREERIPEIGDKFTSRHGQKGVVGGLVGPREHTLFPRWALTHPLFLPPRGVPPEDPRRGGKKGGVGSAPRRGK